MGLQLAGGNDEGLGPRHTEQELGAHGSGKRGQVCLEKTRYGAGPLAECQTTGYLGTTP